MDTKAWPSRSAKATAVDETLDYRGSARRLPGDHVAEQSDPKKRRPLGILSLVNTRQPVKSRTYNPLALRAEEGETPPLMLRVLIIVVSLGARASRAVGAGPTL